MTPQDDAIKIRILINDKSRGQYLVLVLFLHVHGRPEELRGIGVHGALHELDMAGHFGGFSDCLRNGAWTNNDSMKKYEKSMDIVQNLDQMIDKYFDYCNEMVHSRTYNGIENLCWSQEVKK